ncbi:MAG TPA: metalloregulator ArsR/SmtB family transcription factor [Candidatus Elarobacter sp.]|nr:metalloregulator ArsR/SmtB family transcription factor [Candidatus Elarobacter sp.]
MPAALAHDTDIATDRTARLFHALSDVTRLEIIEQLQAGERCVCELTNTLDAAQSRLSFHLKVLKDAGLVSDRREGRWSYYELRREAFDEAAGALRAMTPRSRRTLRVSDACCG